MSPATGRDQLSRLIRLTDVVYAVALIFIVEWLPLPSESIGQHESLTILQLFAGHGRNLVGELIGLLFIIIYWLRSNTLLAPLEHTDGVHTGFSIVSVFFVLVLLYSVRIGDDLMPSSRRAAESIVVTRHNATGNNLRQLPTRPSSLSRGLPISRRGVILVSRARIVNP